MPCDKCGNIIAVGDQHDCPAGSDRVSFQTIDSGIVKIGMDIKEASWNQTRDGFAELTLITLNGSKIIYKVERRTAISVCRKVMGGPR